MKITVNHNKVIKVGVNYLYHDQWFNQFELLYSNQNIEYSIEHTAHTLITTWQVYIDR